MYTKTKKHYALIQDESCDNIIEPTKDIKHTDVNDTELMHENNIINDDIIDNSTQKTSDSRHDVLNHDLFEKTSISTNNIKQVFQKMVRENHTLTYRNDQE